MKPILLFLWKNLFYIVGCTIVGFAYFATDGTRDFYYSIIRRQTHFCSVMGQQNEELDFRYVKRGFPTSTPRKIQNSGPVICYGVPPHATNWPLASAAAFRPGMLQYLIRNGANVQERGPYGYTAMHEAYNYSSYRALIEAGADVNALGGFNATPLDLCRNRNADVIQLLLEHGARKCVGFLQNDRDINSLTSYKRPPFTFENNQAALNDLVKKYQQDPKYNRLMTETETVDAMLSDLSYTDKKTIEVLLDFHPTLNASDSKSGPTLLMRICDRLGPNEYDPELDEAIITKAIKRGAEVNRRNPYDGSTALHYAVRNHSYSAVKALLAQGADPNIRDKKGRKPEDMLSGIEDYLK